MNKSNLTQYQKKRLIQSGHRCKICGELITNTEDIIFIKRHIGKLIQYLFYHERCYDGKEEQEKYVESKVTAKETI